VLGRNKVLTWLNARTSVHQQRCIDAEYERVRYKYPKLLHHYVRYPRISSAYFLHSLHPLRSNSFTIHQRLLPFPKREIPTYIHTMKFFAVSLLASLAAASPIAAPEPSNNEMEDLVARQLIGGSRTELESGSSSACPKAILVFARGSTETGNLVSSQNNFALSFISSHVPRKGCLTGHLADNTYRALWVHLSEVRLKANTAQTTSGSKVLAAHTTLPLAATFFLEDPRQLPLQRWFAS
jgi:hypothetical protein